jgi:hypothetical protein
MQDFSKSLIKDIELILGMIFVKTQNYNNNY